jgi:hypothetical protein
MCRCCLLALVFVAGGCVFSVDGIPAPGDTDFAAGAFDLGVTEDAALTPDDLAGLDLIGVDLKQPPPADMTPPVLPSHVSADRLKPGAPSLIGATAIDTTNLTITPSPVQKFTFEADSNGVAVLSVGAWTVNQDVRITGSRPLIVVASDVVQISKIIDIGSRGRNAGAGGQSIGTGTGGNGNTSGMQDSGGGGGGFGTAGAVGGASENGMAAGGLPGALHSSMISDFRGGSGGGVGGSAGACANNLGTGGAGGGALQIFSAVSITMTAPGGINAGGGGGLGGCGSSASAGGGGGSGGLIFLEAPTITVGGKLSANGGGGGGGGINSGGPGGEDDGDNGGDGQLTNMVASGGPGGENNGDRGGNGGAGGAGITDPAAGSPQTNGGGGGGAVGRIWLRTRGAPATSAGNISPPAIMSTSL